MNFNGGSAFNQSGGTNDVSGILDIAYNKGTAKYTLSGGQLSTGGTIIGDGSGGTPTGTFDQSGGTHTVTGDLIVGNGYGSQGFYRLSGASTVTLDVSGTITLGALGSGQFDQSGGVVTTVGLVLGASGTTPNPTGIYNLTGTGSLQVLGNETIGGLGHGEFYQSGASMHTITGVLAIGDGPNIYHDDTNGTRYREAGYVGSVVDSIPRSGYYQLNGGTLSTQTTIVGSQGTGTFVQNGGEHVVSTDLIIGQQNSAMVRGCADHCSLGGPAMGTYNFNGGTLTVGGQIIVGDAGVGVLNIAGGAVNAGGIVNRGTLNYSAESIVLPSATFTNDGQFTFSGAGTRSLTGALVNTGRVTPGGPTQTLAITGDFTQTSAGLFDVALHGGTLGASLLTAAGTASLAGTLNLICFGTCTYTAGQTIEILAASGGVSGAFAALTGFGPGVFSVDYSTPNEVLLRVAEVPEPHTYLTLLAGLAAVGFVIRRRRNRRG